MADRGTERDIKKWHREGEGLRERKTGSDKEREGQRKI